jgi:hypothetical protein
MAERPPCCGGTKCDFRPRRLRALRRRNAIAPDRDGVALAVKLAKQHRAGLEVARRWPGVSREAVQQRQAVTIKTAEDLFLDPHCDHAADQILARRQIGSQPSYSTPR